MIAKSQNTGIVLASDVETAKTLFKRMKGLLGRAGIEKGYGMLIAPCNSIHMFFMKFAIDAVFLDKKGRVAHVIENFKPWRLSPVILNAQSVLELPAGTLEGRIKKGDIINFI